MSRDCQFSRQTIDACYKHAERYENDLRGEMSKGVPNDLASINSLIHELNGNVKRLKHLQEKLNYDIELTDDFRQTEITRRDSVQCREKKGRSRAQQDNDDSGVYSINSETFLSQSTDRYDGDDDKSNQKNATTIGGPHNIHPSDEAPKNNLNN